MANLNDLPDVNVDPTTFRTTYAALFVRKVNENTRFGEGDVRARAVAEWGDFIDGSIAALQAYVYGLSATTISGTNNHVVRVDGTTGLQDSGVVIDDFDNVTGVASLTTTGAVTVGSGFTV